MSTRITLIILTFLFVLSGYAQITINTRQSFLRKTALVKLDTVDVEFIHVQMHGRLFNLKMTCSVDYGQKRKYGYRKSMIRQADGRRKMFNSEADIINFITGNGWDYIEYDTYAFVFKRRK